MKIQLIQPTWISLERISILLSDGMPQIDLNLIISQESRIKWVASFLKHPVCIMISIHPSIFIKALDSRKQDFSVSLHEIRCNVNSANILEKTSNDKNIEECYTIQGDENV